MRNISRKASGTSRRVMALAIAAALCLSTLAAASPAEAAGFTKPKLAVKKKTLYYNKKGKKTYTLKVKSNKVKKIVSTTWKTSKKSVISISKKKKMSVKLTAKKKGKATVTATVQYVPKGKWMVRTVTLKCKVTSKKAAVSKATPSPVKATPTPTSTNGSVDQQAAMVELSQSEVTFNSTEEGENTTTLTAAVKNAQGKELEDQEVTWSTDNDKVAGVDDEGTVTAKKEGTANITASAGSVKSAPCVVTVDTTAPTVEGVRITDYKTITAYFDEPVEGDPKVSVTRSSTFGMAAMLSDETVRMTPVLAKDGRSLTMTSASALPEGTYNLVITGLSDRAGNELAGGEATAIKQQSRPTDFVCRTEEVPAGQDEVNVYYNVVDQYGETMKGETIGDLKAEAVTESGMPLDIRVEEEKNCLILSGTVGKLAEGRKILITLSSKNLGLESEFTTVLVDPTGVGKAVKIEQIITSLGDSETPEFTLDPDAANNVFTLSAELSDKFGSPVTEDVIYAIKGNKNIAEFVDEDGNDRQTISAKSDEKVKVRAKNKGELMITAYLASDDSLNKDITITIKPTQLEKIIVGELASGYNMQESQAKITLEPLGTGLTAKDLKWEAVDDSSKERIQNIQFEEASDGSGIYVGVTAKSDGQSTSINFRVYYEDEAKDRIAQSDVVNYHSVPIPVVDSISITPFDQSVPAGNTIETSYKLLNRFGEDVTKDAKGQLVATPTGSVSVVEAKEGILSIRGISASEAMITLTYGNISASVDVTVVAAAQLKEVRFAEQSVDLIATPGEKQYIPLTFYDQHGNTYDLSKEEADTVKLDSKIDGKNDSSAVEIKYYKSAGNGGYELATDSSDKIEAICLEYPMSSGAKPGDILTVTLGCNKENFVSEELTVTIKEERKASGLKFAEASKSAVPGVEVTNAFTVTDQYGEETSLSGDQDFAIQVTKDNTKVDSVEGNAENGSSAITLNEAGTYIVTVYVTNGSDDELTSSSVQDSYTLNIDSARALIEKIEIDNIVIDSNGESHDISEVEYIRMNETGITSLQLGYKAYDKNDNEIVLGENTLTSNELVWSVSGTNVTAAVSDSGGLTITQKGSNTDGTVTVGLNYVPTSKKASEKVIRVSSEESRAKAGTYQIVIPSGGEKPSDEDTPIDAETVEEIFSATTYKITAVDQYGDLMYVNNLYAVYADDETAVSVSKGSNGEFTVTPKSETEKTTVVNVLVTENEVLRFTVGKGKMLFETTDIRETWANRADDFANTYYNTGKTDVDDSLCYFTIPYDTTQGTSKNVKSVKLGNDTLNKEVKISVGNNTFINVPDYKQDEDGNLLISYVFVALHDTNASGEMIFTIEFTDGTKSAAILQVDNMEDDLCCTDVKAKETDGTQTVSVEKENGDKVESCILQLLEDSQEEDNWKHLVLFSFSKTSSYYFTKKVTTSDEGVVTTAYGFTEPEENTDGALGYYPPRNGGTVEYTVATLERHGVAQITLNVKGYEGAQTVD